MDILDYIKQFPPFMGESVQYYHQRGNRFYFRSLRDEKTMFIQVANHQKNDVLKQLKMGEFYDTK
jgi:hypothetical protein